MEEIKMGPFHWILLALFVVALSFLSMKSGTAPNPLMPGVKIPEAVRPSIKAIEVPTESAPPPVDVTETTDTLETVVPPASENAPSTESH